MLYPRYFATRRLAAVACLGALLFLQAPAFAALAIASGVCCTGVYCPIAAHHHPALVAPSSASAKTEEAPMDCGHAMNHDISHRAGALRSCSMSCCHTPEPFALHAYAFVLPRVVALAVPTLFAETVSALRITEQSAFLLPLSPPPKFLRA